MQEMSEPCVSWEGGLTVERQLPFFVYFIFFSNMVIPWYRIAETMQRITMLITTISILKR